MGRRMCGVILHILLVWVVQAQKAEVLMVPLSQGNLAPLAEELTKKLQEELGKSGLSVVFAPESPEGFLSSEDRKVLQESARMKNLAFLLIQDRDPQEADTIRHDLISTFDGRLLSTVLVRGDSGRSALLRPVLLAREIVQQLKNLPPVVVVNTPFPPISDDIPLLAPVPVLPARSLPSVQLSGGAAVELAGLSDPGYLLRMDLLWPFRTLSLPVSFGLGVGWLSHTWKSDPFPLTWDFALLHFRGRADWNFWSTASLSADLGLGFGLLQLHPESIPVKRKLLPELMGGVLLQIGLGSRFFFNGGSHIFLLGNPGRPLIVWSAEAALGWKL